MLSKLTSIQRRVKTFEQQLQHFHLDEQQQQAAFEAKRQLQECSHEILEEFQETKKINYKCDDSKKHNLCESVLTKATENDDKVTLRKSRYRSKKNRQCPKCKSLQKKQMIQSVQSPKKKKLSGMINSINLQENFKPPSSHCEDMKFRLGNKIQNYRQKILHKSGFYGITFRSHTLDEAKTKDCKITRLHSSKKNKPKMSFSQQDQASMNRPYSFNDTMSGMKLSKFGKSKGYSLRNFFEPEGIMKPISCRGSGVKLRPQFLRLILKIKQKQQMICNKKVTEYRMKLKK